jgi:hypothetical protein
MIYALSLLLAQHLTPDRAILLHKRGEPVRYDFFSSTLHQGVLYFVDAEDRRILSCSLEPAASDRGSLHPLPEFYRAAEGTTLCSLSSGPQGLSWLEWNPKLNITELVIFSPESKALAHHALGVQAGDLVQRASGFLFVPSRVALSEGEAQMAEIADWDQNLTQKTPWFSARDSAAGTTLGLWQEEALQGAKEGSRQLMGCLLNLRYQPGGRLLCFNRRGFLLSLHRETKVELATRIELPEGGELLDAVDLGRGILVGIRVPTHYAFTANLPAETPCNHLWLLDYQGQVIEKYTAARYEDPLRLHLVDEHLVIVNDLAVLFYRLPGL